MRAPYISSLGLSRLKNLALILACLCILPCHSTGAEEAIKIGASLPLTGPSATYGNDVKNILIFFNEKLAGGRYQLVIEDDRCDPREGVNIAHRFTNIEKLRYALVTCSGPTMAAMPIYDKAGTVVLSMAGTPLASGISPYHFRYRTSDEASAPLLAAYLRKHHKLLGTLTEQTDYALGTKRQLIKALDGSGLKIAEEDYLPGTTDFRSLLLKFKNAGVEGLIVLPQSELGFVAAVKQFRELGFSVPVYGSLFPASSTFRRLAGADANGIIFPILPTNDEMNAEGRKLLAEFEGKYGAMNSLDYIFYTTYDALKALHAAIQSGQNVKDYLHAQRFQGLLSEFYFDAKGDIQGLPFVMRIIQNGQIVPLGD